MSLINDVLRDLDRRHANSGERNGIPNDVRPLPPAARSVPLYRLSLIGSSVLVASGALWLLFWQSGKKVDPPIDIAVSFVKSPAPEAEVGQRSATIAMTPEAQPTAVAPNLKPLSSVTPVVGNLSVVTMHNKVSGSSTTQSNTSSPIEKSDTPSGERRLKLAGEIKALDPDRSTARAKNSEVGAVPSVQSQDDWMKAQAFIRSGRHEEAESLLRKIVDSQPNQLAARQALIGILLSARRYTDAIPILHDGLAHYPEQVSWAMNLARLYVDGGDYSKGWEVLSIGLPHAQQQADYLAFAGTILQRLDRPGDAAAQYQAALRLRPEEARWWVGLGISLESSAHPAEARIAYQRAKSIGNYSPEIAKFIEQKLQ